MTESSRAHQGAFSRALELTRAALREAPAGLLTDFDGTLAPVVADPMLARLVDGAGGALHALVERLAVVAVITGRAADDVRGLVDVPGTLILGNHGVEWLEPGSAAPQAVAGAADVAGALERVIATLPAMPGVVIERKGLSATVHYRAAPDPAAAREHLHVAVRSASAPAIEVRDGRMSVELRARGLGDKGVGARAVVERYGLRGVVVMGDDLTDLDMFRAIEALRAAGTVTGVIVGVGGADHEVPPEVIAASDVVLADPYEAARLLAALAAD